MIDKIPFEHAFKKLEEINKRLEEGAESLEISIKLYKEANELAKYCEKILNEAEQEVTILE
jgi:exodeoxyribonuclease VII small subunit